MDSNNTTAYVISICKKILYEKSNPENDGQLLALFEASDFNAFDESALAWILNALNFMTVNTIQDNIKFIKIESAKLKILSEFMAKYDYLAGLEPDNGETAEVLLKNDIGIIYKRYLPTSSSSFLLPKDDQLGSLKLRGFDNNGQEFTAELEIDSQGFVKNILKEPTLKKSNPIPETFDDLYSELMSDILKYED